MGNKYSTASSTSTDDEPGPFTTSSLSTVRVNDDDTKVDDVLFYDAIDTDIQLNETPLLLQGDLNDTAIVQPLPGKGIRGNRITTDVRTASTTATTTTAATTACSTVEKEEQDKNGSNNETYYAPLSSSVTVNIASIPTGTSTDGTVEKNGYYDSISSKNKYNLTSSSSASIIGDITTPTNTIVEKKDGSSKRKNDLLCSTIANGSTAAAAAPIEKKQKKEPIEEKKKEDSLKNMIYLPPDESVVAAAAPATKLASEPPKVSIATTTTPNNITETSKKDLSVVSATTASSSSTKGSASPSSKNTPVVASVGLNGTILPTHKNNGVEKIEDHQEIDNETNNQGQEEITVSLPNSSAVCPTPQPCQDSGGILPAVHDAKHPNNFVTEANQCQLGSTTVYPAQEQPIPPPGCFLSTHQGLPNCNTLLPAPLQPPPQLMWARFENQTTMKMITGAENVPTTKKDTTFKEQYELKVAQGNKSSPSPQDHFVLQENNEIRPNSIDCHTNELRSTVSSEPLRTALPVECAPHNNTAGGTGAPPVPSLCSTVVAQGSTATHPIHSKSKTRSDDNDDAGFSLMEDVKEVASTPSVPQSAVSPLSPISKPFRNDENLVVGPTELTDAAMSQTQPPKVLKPSQSRELLPHQPSSKIMKEESSSALSVFLQEPSIPPKNNVFSPLVSRKLPPQYDEEEKKESCEATNRNVIAERHADLVMGGEKAVIPSTRTSHHQDAVEMSIDDGGQNLPKKEKDIMEDLVADKLTKAISTTTTPAQRDVNVATSSCEYGAHVPINKLVEKKALDPRSASTKTASSTGYRGIGDNSSTRGTLSCIQNGKDTGEGHQIPEKAAPLLSAISPRTLHVAQKENGGEKCYAIDVVQVSEPENRNPEEVVEDEPRNERNTGEKNSLDFSKKDTSSSMFEDEVEHGERSLRYNHAASRKNLSTMKDDHDMPHSLFESEITHIFNDVSSIKESAAAGNHDMTKSLHDNVNSSNYMEKFEGEQLLPSKTTSRNNNALPPGRRGAEKDNESTCTTRETAPASSLPVTYATNCPHRNTDIRTAETKHALLHRTEAPTELMQIMLEQVEQEQEQWNKRLQSEEAQDGTMEIDAVEDLPSGIKYNEKKKIQHGAVSIHDYNEEEGGGDDDDGGSIVSSDSDISLNSSEDEVLLPNSSNNAQIKMIEQQHDFVSNAETVETSNGKAWQWQNDKDKFFSDKDILHGGDRVQNAALRSHPGNRRYIDIVEKHRFNFQKTRVGRNRERMMRRILDEIQANGARFLMSENIYDKKSKWNERYSLHVHNELSNDLLRESSAISTFDHLITDLHGPNKTNAEQIEQQRNEKDAFLEGVIKNYIQGTASSATSASRQDGNLAQGSSPNTHSSRRMSMLTKAASLLRREVGGIDVDNMIQDPGSSGSITEKKTIDEMMKSSSAAASDELDHISRKELVHRLRTALLEIDELRARLSRQDSVSHCSDSPNKRTSTAKVPLPKYHALRESTAFTGPVIFLSQEDCITYGTAAEEFQSFHSISDALKFCLSHLRQERNQLLTADTALAWAGEETRFDDDSSPRKFHALRKSDAFSGAVIFLSLEDRVSCVPTTTKDDFQSFDNISEALKFARSSSPKKSPSSGEGENSNAKRKRSFKEVQELLKPSKTKKAKKTKNRARVASSTDYETKLNLAFEERVSEWLDYRAKHGCDPKGNIGLGKWVIEQRYKYRMAKEGKARGIRKDRKKRLQDLGFEWVNNNEPPKSATSNEKRYDTNVGISWEDRYKQLLEFVEEHGHAFIPPKHPGGLRNWAIHQCAHYKKYKAGEKSILTRHRVANLRSAGFDFTNPNLLREEEVVGSSAGDDSGSDVETEGNDTDSLIEGTTHA